MNKQSNYALAFCGQKAVSLLCVFFLIIVILHFGKSMAGTVSDAEKEAAKKRFVEYFKNVFDGLKLKEKEWWAARYRNDKLGVGFGGIEMMIEVSHREASEHGGLRDVIIMSVDEKGSSLEIKAYAVFKDNYKRYILFPMEREEGVWKMSTIGHEVNRFAP